jgi:hypothetical protein
MIELNHDNWFTRPLFVIFIALLLLSGDALSEDLGGANRENRSASCYPFGSVPEEAR